MVDVTLAQRSPERERLINSSFRSSNASMVLAGLGLLSWIVAVTSANFLAMGPLGLVTVLGWTYFLGLGLVVIGFALELMRIQLRERRLIAFILLLILYVFATACSHE